MAKINIIFNDKNYSIDESSFAAASARLQQHLSTTMSGSGATITLGGLSFNVDSEKLSSATNNFVSHLSKIAGSGSQVTIGGVEYSVGSDKVSGAVAELESVLSGLHEPDVVIVLDEAILDSHVLG